MTKRVLICGPPDYCTCPAVAWTCRGDCDGAQRRNEAQRSAGDGHPRRADAPQGDENGPGVHTPRVGVENGPERHAGDVRALRPYTQDLPETSSEQRMHLLDETCWCHPTVSVDLWRITHHPQAQP